MNSGSCRLHCRGSKVVWENLCLTNSLSASGACEQEACIISGSLLVESPSAMTEIWVGELWIVLNAEPSERVLLLRFHSEREQMMARSEECG
jgi:hypothetical protein